MTLFCRKLVAMKASRELIAMKIIRSGVVMKFTKGNFRNENFYLRKLSAIIKLPLIFLMFISHPCINNEPTENNGLYLL